MRIISCILILFFFYPCYSQTKIDSLLSQPVSTNDSLYVNQDTIPDNSKPTKVDSTKKSFPVKDSLLHKDSVPNKNANGQTNLYKYLPIKNKFTLFDQKNDSLFRRFNRKDSLLSKKSGDSLQSIKSKSISFLQKQVMGLKPKGTISLGYDYGVLPFVAGSNYPSGGYRTEGKISFLVLNIPLELTYYYTSIKNVIGINNYYRFSYDANRYKELINQKLNVNNELNQVQLRQLQTQQQQLLKKIEYLNFIQQTNFSQLSKADSLKNSNVSKVNKDEKIIKDSLGNLKELTNPNANELNKYKRILKDSLAAYTDSTKLTNNPLNKSPLQTNIDSLKNSYHYQQKKDSITKELNKYKAQYDTVKQQMNKLNIEINQVKNLQKNATSLTNPYLSKAQQFLSHIKKFEIGLCNPSYSMFLTSNIPLRGINMEYNKNNNFFAFTYGTTVNNLLYNTNTLQGAIQGTRNLYNYFDFGNLSAGRKILSVKGGMGTKEGSHFYVGFLVGHGYTDNSSQPVSDQPSNTKECNVVMEIDARYKFSQNLSADVVLGKSSIQPEDITIQQVRQAVNQILTNYRSYALNAKLNYDIKKTNTKLTLTTRWIDPFFNSFGIGFIRSDNLRYEMKVEQQITKKIKYSISYRHEEDNLLNLLNYTNTIRTINNSLNIKVNKQFNIRLNYVPLLTELKSLDSITKSKNQISTGMLSYTPKFKQVTAQFNLVISKYVISGDSVKINYENFTYSQQFQFKSGFKTGLNVTWFKNNIKDTLNNNTYLAVIDAGYSAKNNTSFTVGGKVAYQSNAQPQYGFVAKVIIKLYKGLSWESSAEKILIGEYYSTFITSQIKKFPYYCTTKLVLKF